MSIRYIEGGNVLQLLGTPLSINRTEGSNVLQGGENL